MKEFARKHYSSSLYCNFERQEDIKTVFKTTKDPVEIIKALSIIFHSNIEKGRTLIIFDEIKECPEAIGALIENFVLTELQHFNNDSIFYYSASNMEVDFIIQLNGDIVL